ncbi:type IV secretion system protein [Campylobacter ureolyticus]|uniref:virB8 family protein n=1 Tax=Campylobacter ureolyticus TaxID=827 RepID=UPI0022B2FEE1|nr:type IV secretion system protein [Campylobacter ureolyticus]MCZ6156849.1 type IV secretion system protein [Campylobacter ureolyticus]
MIDNNDTKTAISYEASIRYLVEKSNRRAWLIAFLSIFISIISVTAVVFLTPLKSVEPYVIRVDNTTGMVDIITSVNQTEFVSDNEALDKYFTTSYVKIREGYFYNILQNDYTTVQIWSSPEVSSDYLKIYEGDNSRVDILKNRTEIDVEINSVTLGNSNGMKMATIRFNQIYKDAKSRTITNKKAKIVTLAYDYSPQSLMTENERLINPLGFKVLTYRVDGEVER